MFCVVFLGIQKMGPVPFFDTHSKGNSTEFCLRTVYHECLLFWECTQPATTVRVATPKGTNCLVCPIHHPQYQVSGSMAWLRGKYHSSPAKHLDDDSSSTGSIISSQSNDNRKSLKPSDLQDTKHQSPMIDGMDIIPYENAKNLFDPDKGKYSAIGHLEHYRQLMIARGIDLNHGVPSVNQKSNEEDSSSDSKSAPSVCNSRSSTSSSSSSGSSSSFSLSSSFSSAVGSDGSKLMPECAAGKKCCAPTESRLANSPHNCWGCKKKIHSALQCGSSISDLIFKNPPVVGMSLNNGNIIEEGDNNKTRAICFTCLGPLSIFFTGSKHGEPDCKLVEGQFRSKNTVTEALPVQPAITQAVTSVAEDHDVNENVLNFLPECKDACFVGKTNIGCGHICKNVQINKVGEYILFPSQCWHYGYFNDSS